MASYNNDVDSFITPHRIDRIEEVSLDESLLEPAGHFGAGFDIYFLSNLAARVEFRYWIPQTTERRTRMFVFGAAYYF